MQNDLASEQPQSLTPTARSKVRRLPQRSSYERNLIYKILDEGLVCHVGFAVEGQPFVIPTAYGRVADRLYIHGSPMSRMVKALSTGIEICVTVTLLDGLVLARSAFHHSMNYRSIVVFGEATVVDELEQKMAALQAFTEQIVPGRWADIRQPNREELEATVVLSLPLEEASAKIRVGHPIDDPEDYNLPVWAGEIPLKLKADLPVNDPSLPTEIKPPQYIFNQSRFG
jgi:uncharacterized protein